MSASPLTRNKGGILAYESHYVQSDGGHPPHHPLGRVGPSLCPITRQHQSTFISVVIHHTEYVLCYSILATCGQSQFTSRYRKKLPMTPANLQQTIGIVNRYIRQNAQGLAYIRVAQLRQAGLSPQEIRWTQAQIKHYNNNILRGTLTPIRSSTSTAPMSIPQTSAGNTFSSSAVTSMSTGNLAYGWFTANRPYHYTQDFWWGQSLILNELATSKMEGAIWMIVGGATIASAAAAKLSFIPYSAAVSTLLIVAAGGYTTEAGWMEQADNGFGVHLNSTWTSVPLGIYANTP